MKQTIYYSIIAVGMLSIAFLCWFVVAPRSEAKFSTEELRAMFSSGASPDERALGAAGLGERRDVASVPALLEALDDASPQVRAHAGVAVQKILGADYYFNADAPTVERQAVVARYRDLWKAWQLKHSATSEHTEPAVAGGGS